MQTIKNIMEKKGTEMTAGEALIYSGLAMVTVYGVVAVVGAVGYAGYKLTDTIRKKIAHRRYEKLCEEDKEETEEE